jgi:MoaA/NifB/PqqE/SkfB family radical SAM enzyme
MNTTRTHLNETVARRKEPALAGWDFDSNLIVQALKALRMPNPSLDLSNACNLNCPYCFIEEKNSKRKLRQPHELSIDETFAILDDFVVAGALTVNLVGAGEPTIDPHFEMIIRRVAELGLTTVLFSNGITIAKKPSLADFLYEQRVTVVLKFNSFDAAVQDLVAGRAGYAVLRDKALASLLKRGFANSNPTRLGLDTVAVHGNLHELPRLQKYCRENNLFPIIADYIPTGRTDAGAFQGHASISTAESGQQKAIEELLQPLQPQQRITLRNSLKIVDNSFGIASQGLCAYYSGAACTQTLGVYVDILGNIWPCVAKRQIGIGHIPLGSIRSGDKPSAIWVQHPTLARIRDGFTGNCPYKSTLTL